MTTFLTIIIGLSFGSLIVIIIKSFYLPGARKIQAIMCFGKLYTIIANVEGKKIYKGSTQDNGPTKWDLVNIDPRDKRKSNIYFFLWPFFNIYTYSLTYTKGKMIGEEDADEKVIWKNQETRQCIISSTGISNHLEWRVEYPTVTSNLNTNELAVVNTYTNNLIEVKNPAKTFFDVKNWLDATNDILSAGLRSLVANKTLYELNQFSRDEKDKFNIDEKDKFNIEMQKLVNSNSIEQIGLPTFGLHLLNTILKDFHPANDKAKNLMDAFANKAIVEQEGNAKIIKAEKEKAAKKINAEGDAIAFEINQEKIVLWRKKYLVDTGLAEVDDEGNIIKLVPDANIKVSAEAIKELSKLTGTLVFDNSSLNKMFAINSEKKV